MLFYFKMIATCGQGVHPIAVGFVMAAVMGNTLDPLGTTIGSPKILLVMQVA